ncbi:MAG: two-component system activity regulator YycH [Aerococcus sp.]|nr:two-component system activity regulator YycH [Aerococcus sp.]
MKAFWNRFIHLILVTVVIVSLLFSLMILHPSLPLMDRFMHGEDEVNNGPRVTQQENNETNTPTLTESTRPEGLVYYSGGQFRESGTKALLNVVIETIRPLLTSDKEVKAEKQNVSTYQTNILSQAPYVELIFPDQIDLAIFKQSEDQENHHFNRLGYALGDKMLYLINDEKNEVYTLPLNQALDQMKSTLDKYKEDFYAVEQVLLHNQVAYVSTEDRMVPTLRYMMERQSNSKLLNALFPESEEIHDYSDTQMSRYFAGGYSLLVNNNDFQSEYREEFGDSEQMPDLDAGYKYLQRVQPENEMWLLSAYNYDQKSCTFRRYVNGLPVFGDHFVSRITLTKPKDNMMEIQFSALSIQTPVTDLEVPMYLPAGKSVLAALNEQGYTNNDIEDLKLGYYWQASDKSNRLIDLKPCWLVKLKGEYYALSALIDLNQYPALQTKNEDNETIELNVMKNTPLEQDDKDLTRANIDSKDESVSGDMTAVGPLLLKGTTKEGSVHYGF